MLGSWLTEEYSLTPVTCFLRITVALVDLICSACFSLYLFSPLSKKPSESEIFCQNRARRNPCSFFCILIYWNSFLSFFTNVARRASAARCFGIFLVFHAGFRPEVVCARFHTFLINMMLTEFAQQ